MSTENFPFLGPKKRSSFEKDGIIFEKIVNLSENSQKPMFANGQCSTSAELTLEMHNLGSEAMENCPLLKGGARQWKVAPGLDGNSRQRKVAPCLDGAAARCKLLFINDD